MRAAALSALRGAVIAAGIAVLVASGLAFRREDWPIYVAFVLLALFLFRFYVEVAPGLTMPMPGLAVSIGFLYVGGLPIALLRATEPALIWLLQKALPARWRARVPGPIGLGGELYHIPWTAKPGERVVAAAEWGMFAIGMGARWGTMSLLVPGARPASHPGVMLVAEIAGYACWGFLSALPLFAFSPVLSTSGEPRRPVRNDLGLVTFALTPFVFLIAYGYEAHGLIGAVWWSLSALGLHFLLKSLSERRILIEEQNRRLEALNRELEHRERLSAIGKMSSVVSHQILQQLGVIGLYAELIRHSEAEADPAVTLARAQANAEAIETARRDVNRVLTDLLVFSKDLRLNLYEHPLGRVVAETVDACRAEADRRGVSLRVEDPADVPVVLDKLKVTQALGNVLRNAIDASPPGGEIAVRVGAHDGWAEVTVSDEGPGVPAGDREAIFTPFFTTKEHGTGLGLAIAREFTEAHGGRLFVEDGDRRGVTFVMRLPLGRRDG